MAVLGVSTMTASLTTSILLLLFIACLTVQIWSCETSFIVQPGTTRVVRLIPFDQYEVLVPVDSLESGQSYYIRQTSESSSYDTIVKRKKVDKEIDESSETTQRLRRSFSKGMRDHQYSSHFTLSSDGHYIDDPLKQNFEIIGSGIDSTQYLVFTLSAVNTALAYDEETLYQESEVTLELIPSGQLNHKKLTSEHTE